jgi:hypothetical protein
MEMSHWPLSAVSPALQVARFQRDLRSKVRVLDGEEQNHIEVLTGKRLQPIPPKEETPPGPEPTPDAPVLTSLDPDHAVIGSPSFTLHVKGTGFTDDCKIVFAGQEEPTTLVSDTEVTTGVNMDVWLGADALPVEVNGPGGLSNALTFTFTAAPGR